MALKPKLTTTFYPVTICGLIQTHFNMTREVINLWLQLFKEGVFTWLIYYWLCELNQGYTSWAAVSYHAYQVSFQVITESIKISLVQFKCCQTSHWKGNSEFIQLNFFLLWWFYPGSLQFLISGHRERHFIVLIKLHWHIS